VLLKNTELNIVPRSSNCTDMSEFQSMQPTNITDENFDAIVLNGEGPVLLDFWASWCVPCNLMKRSVDKAAEALAGEVVVGKINVDDQPDLVTRFGVQATPTFLLVQNGNTLGSFHGIATSSGIVSKTRHVLESARHRFGT